VQVGEWLKTQPEDDPIIMVGNPPAFYYHTGLWAIVVPNESVEQTLMAAQRYRARYLVLDENCPGPLNSLYQGQERYAALELVWDSAHGAPPDTVVYRILDKTEQ
jgi:hypothetical protein